jgi:hypothetical protein
MSDTINYGYEDDNQAQVDGLSFGLNSGITRLVKFEFNPNGGADGATQDALDVVFEIGGREISYRMFPVNKAFDKEGNEITDVKHPAMKKAFKEFNATIVHILSAFVSKDTIKTAFSAPINNFKQFCDVAKAVLPADFNTIILDVFGQYQWQITGDNDKTYVRLPSPRHIKYGKWVCKHIPPAGGEWKQVRLNGGLQYKDGNGNTHPFKRNKWFMSSNFAEQQSSEVIIPETAGTDTGTTDWE